MNSGARTCWVVAHEQTGHHRGRTHCGWFRSKAYSPTLPRTFPGRLRRVPGSPTPAGGLLAGGSIAIRSGASPFLRSQDDARRDGTRATAPRGHRRHRPSAPGPPAGRPRGNPHHPSRHRARSPGRTGVRRTARGSVSVPTMLGSTPSVRVRPGSDEKQPLSAPASTDRSGSPLF